MAGVYIKGMEMPKNCIECPVADGEYGGCLISGTFFTSDANKRQEDCPLIEVKPHGRLIDAEKLYEQTAEWEAQALHMCDVSAQDEEDKREWRRWSTILTERSAFKYDVYDAPTVIESDD